jgi:hypothetical protein
MRFQYTRRRFGRQGITLSGYVIPNLIGNPGGVPNRDFLVAKRRLATGRFSHKKSRAHNPAL